jgi:Polyketide cyclase / dehydrase and lipid transport
MAHFATTVPSSKSPEEAFAYMSDIRNFAQWDKGIIKIDQIVGDGAGLGNVFDITVKGFGGQNSVLRYTTLECDYPTNVLVKGKNWMFTSVDRVTITPTATGCDVTYDAVLTANLIVWPMNIVLGKVFDKVGAVATRGLKKVLA